VLAPLGTPPVEPHHRQDGGRLVDDVSTARAAARGADGQPGAVLRQDGSPRVGRAEQRAEELLQRGGRAVGSPVVEFPRWLPQNTR
jgi:hypothetical protein